MRIPVLLCACYVLAGCTPSSSPAKDPSSETGPPADTGVDAWQYDPALSLAENCWTDIDPVAAGFPEYETLGVVPGSCSGTRHQSIDNVERLVFIGDSITVGTPPSLEEEYFRSVVAAELRARFGEDLDVKSCARFGARTDDYLPEQIPECFPEPDARRTLVVGTMGGNDLFAAAEVVLDGGSELDGLAVLDRAIGYQRDAMHWFRDNPDMFPGGVDVVVGNVYEFTDTTGNLSACELAEVVGISGQVDSVVLATQLLNTAWAEIAVETQTDILFMNESFCGHGYGREDEDGPCYRGPDAELWFDPSCIHPAPLGHAAIARMFLDVIDSSVEAPARR